MPYRLGVDLGTTFTAAAVLDRGGPEMVGLGDRALQVPSVLFLQEDGTFLCGEAAERRARAAPDRAVREFKRRLGDTVPILVAGQPFSPQTLSARLLSWVVVKTTERRGAPPAEVVLTHPANWGGYKKELFTQVAQLADVPHALTCTEPEAAATRYAHRAALRPGDRLAVYDLGGGTFDVCVLQVDGDGFSILGAPQGVEHLGGMDFDEAVFRHVLAQVEDPFAAVDPDDAAAAEALATLRRDCVEAKEALSSDVEAWVRVAPPGAGRGTTVRLTRAELEELVRPSLEETLRATERALRTAEVTPGELAAVVLVGGSSRIPLVSQLVQHHLGVPVAMDTHPKHDIALGAALHRPGRSAAATASAYPGAAGAGPDPGGRDPGGGDPGGRDPAGPDLAGRGPAPAARTPPRRVLVAAAGAAVAAAAAVAVGVALLDGSPGAADGGGDGDGGLVLDDEVVVLSVGEVEGPQDLVVVDGEGTRPLTAEGSEGTVEHGPSFDPDRERLYYVQEDVALDPDDEEAVLRHLLHRAGEEEPVDAFGEPLPEDRWCPGRPAWDPTPGGRVALLCLADRWGDPEAVRRVVVTVGVAGDGTLDGGDVRPVPGIDPSVRAISYTGAGELVMVYRDPAVRGVRVLRRDGTVEPVTGGDDRASAVLPGTDHVVFTRDGDVYGVSVDAESPFPCPAAAPRLPGLGGRTLCRLTATPEVDAEPAWSPDGLQVAFLRTADDGSTTLVRLRLEDGATEPLPLTRGLVPAGPPAWASR